MQEQLTGHQVEGEVVERPPQDAHTDFVVETLESDVAVIAVTTLPSENGNGLNSKVEANERGGTPPNNYRDD
jgi:hypothetical protein